MTLRNMREAGDQTVTPFEVLVGLVIIAALIMVALTVRRWDE